MIFVLHYLLFHSGASSAVCLMSVFLKNYAIATSISEIGFLLMLLPFIWTLVKPICCAFADRQQAHKTYLMFLLLITSLSYGFITIPTFYIEFINQNPRLVWYYFAFWVTIGYSCYGAIFSLADALSLNAAIKKNVHWGYYRSCLVISWGIGGCLIGMINETPLLPRYTPGYLVIFATCLFEFFLVALWSKKDFDFSSDLDSDSQQSIEIASDEKNEKELSSDLNQVGLAERDVKIAIGQQQAKGSLPHRLHRLHSLHEQGSMSRGSTARLSPHMVLSIANMVVGEVGSSIKDSFRSDKPKRPRLEDLLGPGELLAKPDESSPQLRRQATLGALNEKAASNQRSMRAHTLTDRAFSVHSSQRSMAALMNNYFGSVKGLKSDSQKEEAQTLDAAQLEQALGTAALADATQPAHSNQQHTDLKPDLDPIEIPDNVQLLLLKIIFKRDPIAIRYFLLFIILGALMNIHLTYFMMHAEEVSHSLGYEFSRVAGTYFLVHACSEVLAFIFIAQYYMPRVGRLISVLTVAIACAIRYGFYATYYPEASPYWAIITETVHGVGFGIVNTLVCDLGRETVDQIDKHLPELIKLGILHRNINPIELKLLLRATMQGVFGGALDGLGNGIGVLCAGLYLEHHGYVDLWAWCFYLSIAIIVIYPLTEMRRICSSFKNKSPA